MLAGYYHKGEGKEQEVIPALIMGAFPVVLGEPPGRCTVDPWRACCRCEGGDEGQTIVAIVFRSLPAIGAGSGHSGELPRPGGRGFLLHFPPQRGRVHRLKGAFPHLPP
jgi:hypothetical protein